MQDGLLAEKLERMRAILREMGSVAVAFSAGVDSTLVLKVALDVLGGANVVAVTGRSPSLAGAEFDEARRLANLLGAELIVLETDEFADANYTANPANRCYFCKLHLFGHMQRLLEERGLAWIASGTNTDDYGDWRPGLEAAREHRVRSPAAEAGLNKQEVRAAARLLGLPNADKPASPCLSSRIPYGEAVTPEKLRMVEQGERFLKDELGFDECRVRHFGRQARLEVPREEINRLSQATTLRRVEGFFRSLGFEEVTVDPEGFRSGKLNDVIAFGRQQG